MSSVITVEQAQQTQQKQIYTNCTRHSPKGHFHIHYDDFERIAGNDEANADALRYFEMHTDYRIANLREKHGIPKTDLPDEDDLWIDASLRAIERGTLRAQSKSTYARCLLDQAPEDAAQSLIQLGFLRRRFIARRGFDEPDVPATVRFRDDGDEFIIVMNDNGDYLGDDGAMHNAVCEGYTAVSRQYLYCIEAVNEAIAKLDWLEPPEPAPRWKPIVRRSDMRGQQRSAPTGETTTSGSVEHALTEKQSRGPGGSRSPGGFFQNEHNIQGPSMSTDESHNSHPYDMESLRSAPWCVETVIGLSSAVIAIPPRDSLDDEDWHMRVEKPMQRVMDNVRLQGFSPQRAWALMDATQRYMTTPGSDSWWTKKWNEERPKEARKTKSPVTTENFANNFAAQYDDMTAKNWWPSETTPYDGPPMDVEPGYEAGYVAVAAGNEEPQEASRGEEEIRGDLQAIEVVAGDPGDALQGEESQGVFDDLQVAVPGKVRPVRGLNAEQYAILGNYILNEYPTVAARCCGFEEIAPGLFVLFIKYALDCYLDFYNVEEYLDISPENQMLLDQAVQYAEELRRVAEAAQGDDGGGGVVRRRSWARQTEKARKLNEQISQLETR